MSMTSIRSQALRSDVPRHRYIVSAAIIVFVLASADLIFACGYWYASYAVPPPRLIQNIASGLLGKHAFTGGESTVLLGVVLQYFMIALMVIAYYIASRRMPMLNRRPLVSGLLYGLILYVVMNHVVLPLSAAPKSPFVVSWILSSVIVHFIIGTTIAFGARWAARSVEDAVAR